MKWSIQKHDSQQKLLNQQNIEKQIMTSISSLL